MARAAQTGCVVAPFVAPSEAIVPAASVALDQTPAPDSPAVQPLGVRLPAIDSQTELDVFLAALAIATIVPVVLFLLFQRVFLRSAGLGGAVKG